MDRIPEDSIRYGEPATPDEADRFFDLADEAFAADSRPFRAEWQRDSHLRTLTIGGELAAGLAIHPSGLWFGGQHIASHAIAAVATVSHRRRSGIGHALMARVLKEARATGVPLTVLYASTPAFYRAVGYETAGERCVFKVETRELPREPGAATIKQQLLADQQPLRALYRSFAASHPGCLDRGEHFWRSIFTPTDDSKRYLYAIEYDDALEGYVCFKTGRDKGVLAVRDVVCVTRRAAQSALALMAAHNSIMHVVTFADGPQGPLHRQLPLNCPRPPLAVYQEWMLRITDVASALRQRGYPDIELDLELDVVDAAIAENSGRYRLRVTPDGASVEADGSGRIQLDVRALAAIYTGYCHPREMREAGLLDGSDSDLDKLGLAFAGPRPFMLDDF